jgi:hypothetical protein
VVSFLAVLLYPPSSSSGLLQVFCTVPGNEQKHCVFGWECKFGAGGSVRGEGDGTGCTFRSAVGMHECSFHCTPFILQAELKQTFPVVSWSQTRLHLQQGSCLLSRRFILRPWRWNSQDFSGLFPSSGIPKKNTTFRKLDLFPSSDEGEEEDTYSVGPLRKS